MRLHWRYGFLTPGRMARAHTWTDDMDKRMKMPIGKFKGQPVADMATPYLLWLVKNDHIRYRHWPLIKKALEVLRSRLDEWEALMAELKVTDPPPPRWRTPEREARRAAEKAEKLRQVEQRRAAEKAAKRGRPLSQAAPRPTDVSDLV